MSSLTFESRESFREWVLKRNVCVIEYCTWGGQFADRQWQAITPDGEALDYGTKKLLKKSSAEEGYDWAIITHHHDGRVSVVETGKGVRNDI